MTGRPLHPAAAHLTPQQLREGRRRRRRVLVERGRLERLIRFAADEPEGPEMIAAQRALVTKVEKALHDYGVELGVISA